MRPLYVEGGAKVRLKLDGPSLVVERDGVALQRFPLERLSRVVLCGRLEASYDALRACAAAGIPVAALDATGAPCGFFLPWRPRASPPSELLEEFLMRPDWRAHYEDWRRAEERRAMLKALRAAGVASLQTYGREAARQALLGAFSDRREAVIILDTWRFLLAVGVARAFSRAGFAPVLAVVKGPMFYLPSHFTEILSWAHWNMLRRATAPGQPWKNRVASYEAIRPRDEQRIEALVERFCTWLGGLRWRLVKPARGCSPTM